MKLRGLIFCTIILILSDLYLMHKISASHERIAAMERSEKSLKRLHSQVLNVKDNISCLRKRLPYFYDCNDDQFCDVIKSMAALCGGSIKEIKSHKKTINLNINFPTEKKLTSFILTFIQKSPRLIHVTQALISRSENEVTLKLQANFNKIKGKKNTPFQIDEPLDGFEILDNTLLASCVIIDDNKKLTQINDNWFKENDQFTGFIVKGIYEDHVVLYSTVLKKSFRLKIGEKTVICP